MTGPGPKRFDKGILSLCAAVAVAALGGVAGPQPAQACSHQIPAPVGPVVLEITGAFECGPPDAPPGAPLRLDIEALKSLGSVTIRTTTIWTQGLQEFEGVPLKRLLDRIEATGSVVDAYAVNDYWTEFPVTELTDDWPVIAYLQNGAPMTLRDKGPLWVVYPYDEGADFNTEDTFARSIWQLERMEIRP